MHKRLTAWLALLLALAAPLLHAEEEFLRPEQAFKVEPALDAVNRALRFDWRIEDGYYLYRDKLRVRALDQGVELGEPHYSPSKTKKDPIFGQVQVYYHQAQVEVPLESLPAGSRELALELRYQGCADRGICYPPQKKTVRLAVPAALAAAQPAAPASSAAPEPSGSALDQLAALGDDLGLGALEDDILPPEKAYQVSAESPDGKTLKVHWEIAEGTYLYQDKLKVRVGGEGVRLGRFELPPADVKKDSIKPDGTIGDVLVYHKAVTLEIPLLRENPAETEIEVLVDYQGCAERGICYPPQKKTLRVLLPALDAATAAAAPAPAETSAPPAPAAEPAPAATPSPPLSEQDRLFNELHDSGFWVALLLSLGFGLLVAFTACMYPMIPILSSLIMGQGEKITPFRAFELSLAYTQGIALTYGVLGIAMALVGKSLGIQSALQTPWVLVPSIILFLALALSMFGFYQIQIPSSIQSRLNEMSNRQKGGSVIGVGLMGVISGLIIGPCGGPVLLAMLAFAASSDNVAHGFLVMWLFGTGMGLPLLVMGAGGGSLLPKAGAWMDTVKATGGVIMLALALSFLERMSPTYVPTSLIMLLWGTLLIVTAVYMGALRQLPEGGSGWLRLWKGLGLVLLIYGAAYIVGVAAGGKDTTQPLRGLAPAGGVAGQAGPAHLEFRRIKGWAGLQRELAAAKAAGKPVMLDFYADWCIYCKTMEKEIFPDPRVIRALEGFVVLQADITPMDEQDKALLERLKLPAPPALFFWDRSGRLRPELRLVGEPTIEQLLENAKQAAR